MLSDATAVTSMRWRSVRALSLMHIVGTTQRRLKSVLYELSVLRSSVRMRLRVRRNGAASAQRSGAPVWPPSRCIRTGSGVSSSSWCRCGRR